MSIPGTAPTVTVFPENLSAQRFYENLLWVNMMDQWREIEEQEERIREQEKRIRQLETRLDKAAAFFARLSAQPDASLK